MIMIRVEIRCDRAHKSFNKVVVMKKKLFKAVVWKERGDGKKRLGAKRMEKS